LIIWQRFLERWAWRKAVELSASGVAVQATIKVVVARVPSRRLTSADRPDNLHFWV
jgi:hypothetical protein